MLFTLFCWDHQKIMLLLVVQHNISITSLNISLWTLVCPWLLFIFVFCSVVHVQPNSKKSFWFELLCYLFCDHFYHLHWCVIYVHVFNNKNILLPSKRVSEDWIEVKCHSCSWKKGHLWLCLWCTNIYKQVHKQNKTKRQKSDYLLPCEPQWNSWVN